MSSLADQLRAEVRVILARAGMSQAEASRRLGVSQKHVSDMLTGRAGMSPDWAEIAALCGRRLIIGSRRKRGGT